MRAHKTEGIVLKRKSLAEADRIITVFSKHYGKISLMAKGVRKITSRRSPHIELLNYSKFSIYKGKSMFTLSEVETLSNFSILKKDLKKIGYAYHICELVDSLCAENQESQQIFELLKTTLLDIEKGKDPKIVVNHFEISLLKLLGFSSIEQDLDFNTHRFIESILERKLKAKEVISSF
ncbi:MAG: DNA repair protein RecO [Candidatus Levybacteria bacterium RIFCSPLOWO2_01_FULL_36_13]|nr:MAG: DNA repair protein RecO [Candidatus Levybacteria bacterium RIFCSPHIGHO2_01_FULL_36_15b]OGH35619.1 MAG: DNA repair protein RecO [Candidatus Levybacteria bacterium RIFCSPLOWO2_01_FULL_36_13]